MAAISGWRTVLSVLLLAAVLPPVRQYVASRYYLVSRIYHNMPHKLPSVAAFGNSSILFSDSVRNCEDAVTVPELGVMILSCDPGRDGWNTVMGAFAQNPAANPGGGIWLYSYLDADARPTRLELVGFPGSEQQFHPIGLGLDVATRTLFVLNNDVRGPRIEVFRLAAPALRHLATIEDELIYSPNSVEVVSATELYITNDHRFPARYHPTLSTLENYLLIAQGTVVHLKLAAEGRPRVELAREVAKFPFPNGIARFNATTMVVASTNTASLHFYTILPDGGLQLASSLRLPFLPDNLSVDDNGVLLIAGHPSPPALNAVSRGRAKCQDMRASQEQEEPAHCRKAMAPSWVSEWTEAGGRRDIYVSSNGFGTSATAVRDAKAGVGFIMGLYEQGLLSWRE